MDTTEAYRETIKKTILDYAKLRPSHGDIRLDAVFDDAHDRYILTQVGWDRGRRVKGNLIYITLHDRKVFIEYDGIENGITGDLISRGIPEDQIVLSYLPELS